MRSIFGLHKNRLEPSPLEGTSSYYAQQAGFDPRRLSRQEWWLWLSAFFVTLLAIVGFFLSSIPSLFRSREHFYEIRADQAEWALAALLLLFNSWLVYRQWVFRRLRKQANEPAAVLEANTMEVSDPTALDVVTGLHTRASIEQQLGKEIARARRRSTSLSLATIHLDDFAQLSERYGRNAGDQVLKEFARRLKESSRGSDLAVRWANDDFVLVLPNCNLGEVKLVLNRLGAVEIDCDGKKVPLAYTTGWVDYQPGDLPGDLVKRAAQILRLYDTASKAS